MKLFRVCMIGCMTGVGYVVFLLIPAGHRLIENIIDPDVGEYYGVLVLSSVIMSVIALIITIVLFFPGIPPDMSEEPILNWGQWILPFMFWSGGWALYGEMRGTFG